MNRLSLTTIKRDIKQGYGHMEYECNYYKGNLTIIHESHDSKILVVFTRNGYQVAYAMPVTEFMTMSRKAFNDRFNAEWYYNAIQVG